MPLSRPPPENTCACQPKAVSSNCTTKYLMQPKPLRAKYKGLLVSHFESYKSEEEDTLGWKVTFDMHILVPFHALFKVQQRNFLLSSRQLRQTRKSRQCAFYLWLMQPASIKQPFDKRLNMQCRNIQQYVLKMKRQRQYTSSFSNTQSKMKCEICNQSIAHYFIST